MNLRILPTFDYNLGTTEAHEMHPTVSLHFLYMISIRQAPFQNMYPGLSDVFLLHTTWRGHPLRWLMSTDIFHCSTAHAVLEQTEMMDL